MKTQTITRKATANTAEPVTAPALPADDRTGDGYDWMDTLDGTAWRVLPNWGSDGWDAGSWPYIIIAVARTLDRNGEVFGGDTSTYWFRSQDACFEAITAEVFFHWASGQSDGRTTSPAPPPNCRCRTGSLSRLDRLETPLVSRLPPAGAPRRHASPR